MENEVINEDLQADALLKQIQNMSQEEIIADILRHEKEVRGIDWEELKADQSLTPSQVKEKANELSKNYLRRLQAELALTDDELPDITKKYLTNNLSDSDVQIMPSWGINQEEADKWKNASGQELKEMIELRLKIMQALELSSSDLAFSQLMLSIGVIAWVKRGYDLYKAARLAGLLRLASVVKAIKGVTIQASRMFVATVIVAVIAEIILYLMEKEAVVYMVLINMTDDKLVKENQHLTHGKQTVQFINTLNETTEDESLEKCTIIDLGGGEIEASYWMGLFSAQKRNMALIGSRGAFYFKPNNTFPVGASVGWEIPLTIIGGDNRCLVSADFGPNSDKFSDKTKDSGSLYSESAYNSTKIVGRMHSGSGSKGYMSVIFETNRLL